MRKLTVPFYVVTPGQRLGLDFKAMKITLPSTHALIFAQFCYQGGIAEGAFALDTSFLKKLTPHERELVESDAPIGPPTLEGKTNLKITKLCDALEDMKLREKKRGR